MEQQSAPPAVAASSRRPERWLLAFVGLAFAAGLYLGLTSHGSFDWQVKTAMAFTMMLAGVLHLVPLVARAPRNEFERQFRVAGATMGAGCILLGVSQLMTGLPRILLMAAATTVFVVTAFRQFKNRFFAPHV